MTDDINIERIIQVKKSVHLELSQHPEQEKRWTIRLI